MALASVTRAESTEGQGHVVNDQQPGFRSGDRNDPPEAGGAEWTTNGQRHQDASPGDSPPPPGSAPKGKLIAADRDVVLDRRETGDINAVQVRMDRSGAEHIDAQRVTMTNSGAKSMSVQSAHLDKSGILLLKGERAVFQDSSSILAQVRDLRISRSRVGIAQSGTTTIENDTRIGVVQTGSLVAGGDITSAFLFSGSVRADGDVNVTFDAISAAALGAGLAVGILLLRRVLRSD